MLAGLRKVREAFAAGKYHGGECASSTRSGDSSAGDAAQVFALDAETSAADPSSSSASRSTRRRTEVKVGMRRDQAPGGQVSVRGGSSGRQQPAAGAQQQQQRRGNAGLLDPRSNAYQVSVLLSLSTFFEHKMQSDALRALQAIRSGGGGGGGERGDGSGSGSQGVDVARIALALRRWGYTIIVRRVVHRWALESVVVEWWVVLTDCRQDIAAV